MSIYEQSIRGQASDPVIFQRSDGGEEFKTIGYFAAEPPNGDEGEGVVCML